MEVVNEAGFAGPSSIVQEMITDGFTRYGRCVGNSVRMLSLKRFLGLETLSAEGDVDLISNNV